jgi:hypothetical protein
MNKSELIKALADKTNQSQVEAKAFCTNHMKPQQTCTDIRQTA